MAIDPPNHGRVVVHWRTEPPRAETFENVRDVDTRGTFLLLRQGNKKKLDQVLLFPADLIESVEFDTRVSRYADVWED